MSCVYSLRQDKMMVAVVPQRQADHQTLSGCILPEREPKAVRLLLAVSKTTGAAEGPTP